MANKPPTSATPKAPRAKRTLRTLTAVEQNLIDSAKLEFNAAKNRLKSSKVLAKFISGIPKLDAWGITQCENAIATRKAELNPAPTAAE